MGAWGTGIKSNDTYTDVYSEFTDLYNDGLSVSKITSKLISRNRDIIDTPEDAHNFWFAVAYAQWECKELDKKILSKVEEIILSGEDLRLWKELDASTPDLRARENALEKFLSKIQTERDKPKSRVKKKFYSSVFTKGDCLTYVMDNGNYGGAFVLTDEQNTSVGKNYIAITTIDRRDKPTLENFKDADVYMRHVEKTSVSGSKLVQKWLDEPQITAFFAKNFTKDTIDIDVIGNLSVFREYIPAYESGSGWHTLKVTIPFKEEYIKINGSPEKTLRLSDLMGSKEDGDNSKEKRSWFRRLFGLE